MARKPGQSPQAMRNRAAKTAAAMASPAAVAQAPKKKVSPAQFAREVRAEVRKITWTSRKETWITSVMVAIMVLLASGFFWVVDVGLSFGAFLLVGWLAFKGGAHQETIRLFAAVGVLGGFTTFSSYSLEAVMMIERRDYALAAAYVVGSVILAVAALFIGLMVARRAFGAAL
ncbi:preprotein translocase subunit SecE [Brevundimonas sp.]|uniref:preprotein translocase subunit SecE n=1 Tax=Brevundimonas sp. TaxID=1871086 RepID=UPI0025C3CB3C|nr:preprotein translocase subunit SecE [Brevundimonas sp.]